jgi:hypothetical protein
MESVVGLMQVDESVWTALLCIARPNMELLNLNRALKKVVAVAKRFV